MPLRMLLADLPRFLRLTQRPACPSAHHKFTLVWHDRHAEQNLAAVPASNSPTSRSVSSCATFLWSSSSCGVADMTCSWWTADMTGRDMHEHDWATTCYEDAPSGSTSRWWADLLAG